MQYVIADHLSRINNGEATDGILDSFPHANLFIVQVTPRQDTTFLFYDWRRPIIDYLQTRRILVDIPLNIRCQIAIRSRPYHLDEMKRLIKNVRIPQTECV